MSGTSSITLSDQPFNKDKIYNKEKEELSDDLVHQKNAVVSSNVVEQNFILIKTFPMSLTKPHFQTRVIQFTNVFIYNYDIKVLREIIKETNV